MLRHQPKKYPEAARGATSTVAGLGMNPLAGVTGSHEGPECGRHVDLVGVYHDRDAVRVEIRLYIDNPRLLRENPRHGGCTAPSGHLWHVQRP